MTGREAVEYIHSMSKFGSRPGLERITYLLGKIGNPEKKLKCIHVAGTNGKGSFCAMLASVLSESGYKTGLFTSPFIRCFNDRIQINGKIISDDDLGETAKDIIEAAEQSDDPPTEFELITAIGFKYFAESGCDLVVLETGLGGRFDATNVIEKPVMSVITGIDLDHTAVLGSTTAEIAFEKAGIIKKGRPVLVGEADGDALETIKKKAEEECAPLTLTDYSSVKAVSTDIGGSVFEYESGEYFLPLKGTYQFRNAANVLAALKILKKEGIKTDENSIRKGLGKVSWPARFETLSESPLIIYDGAHNPQGISAAAENIKTYFRGIKPVILTGVMADKSHREMAEILSPLICEVFTVKPDNPRSLDPASLASEFVSCGCSALPCASVKEGFELSVRAAEEKGLPLLILGTLYMYSDIAKLAEEFGKGRK